jgi:hypothetical protein
MRHDYRIRPPAAGDQVGVSAMIKQREREREREEDPPYKIDYYYCLELEGRSRYYATLTS